VTQIMLDTSVVIDAADLDLSPWKSMTPLISAVSLAELHSGLDVGDVLERAERRQRLSFARAGYRVLPFGEDEAEAFGLLCSLVREAGRQPRRRALDLQIAATAMVHDLPLLTRNAADLADIERAVTIVAV
jgi:predicted nucleic acid-binding protein